MIMNNPSHISMSPTVRSPESAALPSTVGVTRTGDGDEPLTKAEEAVWSDPERLARIEAVLDDPSLAVPLEELE